MSTHQPTEDETVVDEGDEVGTDDRPPDESTLLGVSGVQAEVEAEAARAEAELLHSDDDGTNDSDLFV